MGNTSKLNFQVQITVKTKLVLQIHHHHITIESKLNQIIDLYLYKKKKEAHIFFSKTMFWYSHAPTPQHHKRKQIDMMVLMGPN